MKLIRIGDNILVNADNIDMVELITSRKGKEWVIHVNGKRVTVTRNINEVLSQFSEVELDKQYWSG